MTTINSNLILRSIYFGTVIKKAKALKEFGIAFKSYSWFYEEPKNNLSCGKLFIDFVVDKHFAKAAIHGLSGMAGLNSSVWGFKDNTVKLRFKAY